LRRLHDELRYDFTARKRFKWGCEVLSKIHNHDCVIGYYGHGKIEGALYLLMEYVEGSNLKLMYAAHDPVLLEHVADILIDMGTGLEHMHESGFMHLDFKPENVLVTRNAVCGWRISTWRNRSQDAEKTVQNPAHPPIWRGTIAARRPGPAHGHFCVRSGGV